jgi:ribonucleoside-triphosphate reductase
VSVKGNNIEDLLGDYKKFLPLVRTRDGDFVFHPGFIYQSLLRETSLTKVDAQRITEQTIRFLIAAKLKLITAPLIREVVNVQLLKNGYEQERLQYTRIGLPFYDLKDIFTNPEKNEDAISKILNWVIEEYHAVEKLIEKE